MKTGATVDIFVQLIDHLSGMSNEQRKTVAEEANVSPQTLWNWCWGTTYNPHLNTVVRVSNSLGYTLTLSREKTKLKRVN